MYSSLLGWILIIIGIVSYLGGLAAFIKAQFSTPAERALPGFGQEDLKVIAELLDKLATVLDKFGKLSLPVQWAFLGLLNIGIGAYLLSSRPF